MRSPIFHPMLLEVDPGLAGPRIANPPWRPPVLFHVGSTVGIGVGLEVVWIHLVTEMSPNGEVIDGSRYWWLVGLGGSRGSNFSKPRRT
jgi:hypothetical protein